MRLTVFSKIAEINPRVKLQKGNEYPYVEMIEVEPNRRYVYGVQSREYKGGGTKFIDGDTIFARITPCLENGKIAQFVNSKQIGFGSTEFFVFRAKPGISDPNFIYYLSRSDMIKNPAEKSMSGASGRQRADIKSVINIEVPDLSLSTQCKIAAILSAYDDLIENNLRRIKILEEMAHNLYREWFVNFRFPGHEDTRFVDSPLGKIPEGWEVRKLQDVLELKYGKALKKADRLGGDVPVYGSSGVVGFHNNFLVKGPGIIVGRKGNVGSVFWSNEDFYPIDTVYYVSSKLPLRFLYYELQNKNFINNDAAVPGLNRNQAYSLELVVPTEGILSKFCRIADDFERQAYILKKKNISLRQTRDLLLPKLISGKVDVSELDIKVPEEVAV